VYIASEKSNTQKGESNHEKLLPRQHPAACGYRQEDHIGIAGQ